VARESRSFGKAVTDPADDIDTFTFDNDGSILTAIKGRYNNTVTFAYDDGRRINSESLTIDGMTYTVSHAFDQAGRKTSTTYPDGSVVTRSFTDRDQLESIVYDASTVATFAYDPGMRETSRTHGNGIVTNRTYTRSDSLVTSIDVPGYPGLSFAYTYDENKNVTAETTGGVMAGYSFTAGYDNEDRLTSWQRQNGDSQSWTLTAVGDWQQFTDNGVVQNRTHGPTHELTAIDSTPLTYDAKGNLTQDQFAEQYTWDMDNMLTSATVPATAAQAGQGIEGTHTYEYDALGRRVSKTVNDVAAGTSETTVFVALTDPLAYSPFPEQVVAEYRLGMAPSGAERRFVYGRYIDEPIALLDVNAADAPYYYHANSLYSVAALTVAAGMVAERVGYDAYGLPTLLDASCSNVRTRSVVGNAFTFTGRYRDQETGLFSYRARHHSPKYGRFITRDPIGYIASFNAYEYAKGSPLVFCDPSGLVTIAPLDFEFELGLGVGKRFRVNLHSQTWERCPCDVDPGGYRVKHNFDAEAAFFAGAAAKLTVFGAEFGGDVKFGEVAVKLNGECVEGCGEWPCCKVCGSAGGSMPLPFTPLISGSVGIGIVSVSVSGSITYDVRVCYSFGKGCDKTGWAWGACMTDSYEAYAKLGFFKWAVHHEGKTCWGDEDML